MYLLFWGPASFSQPGNTLFNSTLVHTINIEFQQSNYWDSLLYYKDLGDNTNQDCYMKGRVTIDGIPVDCVGVRLKGNSTFGHPGYKKPIKLSFNEYDAQQEYDGLRSFHLNNSSFDPTMLREKIFLDILNRNGIHAPRCTYATVFYNNVYVGLYKIVESVDKRFLDTHFGNNNGNLYKGDPNGNLVWQGWDQAQYEDDYELKTNETLNDWNNFISFIDKVNNSGPAFFSELESAFDTDAYIQTWVLNNLFVNLDSYLHLAHNYYIYDDPVSTKFQWITWDVSIVFGAFPQWFSNPPDETSITHMYRPASERPLHLHMYESPAYSSAYYSYMCKYLYQELDPSKLFPMIDSLAGRIRADIYAEPEENRMFSTQEFEKNLGFGGVSAFLLANDVPGLKDFILKRRENVISQMCKRAFSCSLRQHYSEEAGTDVRIHPNPSSGTINLRFGIPAEEQENAILIADATGRVVYDKQLKLQPGQTELSINLDGIPAGLYFVRISSPCREVYRRVLFIDQ